MDKTQGFGDLIGQIMIFLYVWFAIVIVLIVIIVLLLVKYFHDKKTNKTENNDRKNVALRICIYVFLALLLFVLSPLILGAFL